MSVYHVKSLYYWTSLLKDVNSQIEHCLKYRQQNWHQQIINTEIPLTLMYFIVIALIGKLKPYPEGHQYALTVIGMLSNYMQCIPLHTREGDEAAHAHLINVYSKDCWIT